SLASAFRAAARINRSKAMRVATESFRLSLLLSLMAIVVQGQNAPDSNPSLSLPQSPYGSSVSEFENINLFNGRMDFIYPVLPVLGRGGARYTMVLPISNQLKTDGFAHSSQ